MQTKQKTAGDGGAGGFPHSWDGEEKTESEHMIAQTVELSTDVARLLAQAGRLAARDRNAAALLLARAERHDAIGRALLPLVERGRHES